MSLNIHGFQSGLQAQAWPGKGRVRNALSSVLAIIKRMARVCAESWAFAHRTRRAMGFSDEAGTVNHITGD